MRTQRVGARTSSVDEAVEAETTGDVELDSAGLAMRELAFKVLDKYPDFDPTWSQETQASWMEGMNKLQDTFNIRNIPAAKR